MRTRALLFPLLAAVPLLLSFTGTAQAAVAPTVVASPAAGAPGARIAASGSGFRADRDGSLSLGSRTVGSFRTTATGTFSVSFTVPASMSPGARNLKATVGWVVARTPFTVLASGTTTTTTTTPPATSTTTTTTRAPSTSTTTGTTRPPSTTTSTTAPPPSATWWKPAKGAAWQIQLSTPVDLTVDAPIYEIDGADNTAAVVQQLHNQGRRVICYLDVGGAESYRDDYSMIPASALGNTVDGWPDERWIDVRQIAALTPVMSARMDMCRNKGFDAVDPDMMEAYAADSGFPITYQDQLTFNRWIADLAHQRGMGVALKQDIDQVKDLWPYFDFAVNEQCAQYDECNLYANTFLSAGKAVFEIEYSVSPDRFCPYARSVGIYAVKKNLSLNAARTVCP
jgi:hypothetical protein